MIIIITLMIIVNHDSDNVWWWIPCQLQPKPGVLSNKQAARRYHLFLQLKRKNNRILDHIDDILTLLPSFHMTTNFPRRWTVHESRAWESSWIFDGEDLNDLNHYDWSQRRRMRKECAHRGPCLHPVSLTPRHNVGQITEDGVWVIFRWGHL